MRSAPEAIPHVPAALARSLQGDAEPFLTRLAGPPGLAAFDADGTLWDGDLGEAVLQQLIADGGLLEPPADPWADYEHRVRRDPADGFAFAGRLMRGLTEANVRERSAKAFAADPAFRVFPELRFLLTELTSRGWQVYIVSASSRWSIEVAAATLGLPPSRVLALDLDVEDGKLTDRVRQPVPTLAGKPELLKAAAGRPPDLAFGNSVLDVPLLASAAVPVAVGRLRSEGREKNQFLQQAERRGWARLEIPADA